MFSIVTAFIVCAVAVALKSWQQLNVVNRKTKAIPLVSFLMAASDFAVISLVVLDGWVVILPMGLGGGVGCLLTIKIFDRYTKNDTTN